MADIQVPMLNLGEIAQMPENIANMGLTQAQTGLVGQQSQGINIANQKAALALGLYKNVLGDFTGQPMQGVPEGSTGASGGADAPTAGSETTSSNQGESIAPNQTAAGSAAPANADTSGDGANVNSIFPEDLAANNLRSFFFVNPAGNPRSQAMLLEASLTGDPGLVQYAKNQRDLQVQSDTAQSQQKAQDLYSYMQQVANAPKGVALTLLKRFSPDVAANIEKEYPNDPADQDLAARESAAHVAAVTHQWTGRALVLGPDGVYRDKVTGMRVPVPVAGMSLQAYAELSAKGEALVSVPLSNGASKQVPLWQADGAPNLAAWASQQASRGLAQLHPSMTPAVSQLAAIAQTPGAAQPVGNSGQQQQQTAQPVPQALPPVTPAQQAYKAQLQKALADPEYRLQRPRVLAGQTATPAVLAQQKVTVQSRAQLMQDSQAATQAAANSLMYLRAAQAVMNSPDRPPTGLAAPFQSLISRAMQAAGSSGMWATQYQKLAKYLSNAALQNARATYGARMTQSEVKLQLGQMNPSAHMTPTAIRALLSENIRNASYTLDSAQRVRQYLLAGNDPQSFAEWNQQFFPQQKIVNQQAPRSNAGGTAAPSAAPTAPAVGTVMRGYRYMGGDPGSPSSWASVGGAK